MTTQHAPISMYRTAEGTGLWEHRGKVAAVGVGHSPTARRWDWKPETSVGANSILALRRAIEDAGVSPDEVDGLVLDPGTATGAHWPEGQPFPMEVINAFNPTSDPLDGIAKLSAEWLLKNMPELVNVKFTMYGRVPPYGCMSQAVVLGAQAVGAGLAQTCLVLKGWHNMEGRYYQGGPNSGDVTETLSNAKRSSRHCEIFSVTVSTSLYSRPITIFLNFGVNLLVVHTRRQIISGRGVAQISEQFHVDKNTLWVLSLGGRHAKPAVERQLFEDDLVHQLFLTASTI